MEKSDRLKIFRILSGFTQTEFAKIANIPQQSIAALENGRYAPAGETGHAIAKILNIPFEYLYFGKTMVSSTKPFVWLPRIPKRAQHIQSMSNDIRVLFPQILEENGLDQVYPAHLADGYVFLIGKRLENSRHIEVCGLLLAEDYFADCFKSILNNLHVLDGFNTSTIRNISVHDFNEASFDNYIVRLSMLTNVSISKKTLWNNYNALRILQMGHPQICINSGILASIVETYLNFLSSNKLNQKQRSELTQLFLKTCENHSAQPIDQQSLHLAMQNIFNPNADNSLT